MWRPVTEGIVTLKEMDDNWTMDDLLECHEALQLRDRQTNPKRLMK